jgi:hypothetical protein
MDGVMMTQAEEHRLARNLEAARKRGRSRKHAEEEALRLAEIQRRMRCSLYARSPFF